MRPAVHRRGGPVRPLRGRLRLAAALCLPALLSSPAQAADAEALAGGARATLHVHCARCHDAAALENPPAKGALGDILDLKALSEREDLVVPGDPDASPLYQVLLARHRPLSVFFGPVPGPSPAETQAVRDWLTALTPSKDVCSGRTPLTPAGVRTDAEAWRAAFDTEGGKPLRFISMAPLYNLCRDDARLAAYRDAAGSVLAGLSKTSAPPAIDTVGETSAVLAFRPGDIGLTAEEWDALTAPVGDIPGVVDADALAARVLAAPPAAETAPGAAQAASTPQTLIAGLDPVAALAAEHQRRVTAARAAAELGESTPTLTDRLGRLEGVHRELGLRLAQSGLDRPSWSWLKAALSGATSPAAAPAVAASGETRLTLALWTGALAYKTGDLLTVHARANAECYLTIVAVEADGLATVLFPNDSVTGNRVAAGTVITVPSDEAKFQLRLDKAGRQGLVGICNARAKRPEGIGHDFERQRFTSLGDWRAFLAATPEKEAAYQKAEQEMRRFRARRDGRPEPPAEQLPVGTEDEARAGLSFHVQGSDP